MAYSEHLDSPFRAHLDKHSTSRGIASCRPPSAIFRAPLSQNHPRETCCAQFQPWRGRSFVATQTVAELSYSACLFQRRLRWIAPSKRISTPADQPIRWDSEHAQRGCPLRAAQSGPSTRTDRLQGRNSDACRSEGQSLAQITKILQFPVI